MIMTIVRGSVPDFGDCLLNTCATGGDTRKIYREEACCGIYFTTNKTGGKRLLDVFSADKEELDCLYEG